MNADTQIKHHIWWIVKQLGETGKYDDFIKQDLPGDVCSEIDSLVDAIQHYDQNCEDDEDYS